MEASACFIYGDKIMIPITKRFLTLLSLALIILPIFILSLWNCRINNQQKLAELQELKNKVKNVEKYSTKLSSYHGAKVLIYDQQGNIYIRAKGKNYLTKVGNINDKNKK